MAAAAGKQYELLFQLSAALGSNFNSVFKKAIDSQKQLSESIKKTNDAQGKIKTYEKATQSINDQRAKLEKLKIEHTEISEKIKTHQKNAEMLRAKITETGDASGELTAALVKEESEIEKNTDKLKRNETQMRQCENRIESESQKLKKAGDALREAGIDTNNLTAENERLQKSYEKLEKAQTNLSNIHQKQAQVKQSISETTGALMKTVGATAAVAAAVYNGPIKTYQGFEEEMSKVRGITKATPEDFQKLKTSAQEAGKTTWATATESAQALEYMSLAGWSVNDSVSNLDGMLKIAKITGKDLGPSTDLVTDSMSAMGIEVNDLSHYLDVMTKANNVANTSADALMEAILGCGGIAKGNAVNVEDLSTALSVLANNGTKGSEAGTALNSILTRMTTKEKALKEMASLGVDVFDEQTGEFRGMGNVLKDVYAATKDMTTAEQDAVLAAIAGTNYGTEFRYMLDSVSEAAEGQAGSWDVLNKAMYKSKGAADEMYETMMDNLSGSMTECKSAIEAVQLALGEALVPTLTKAIRFTTPYIQQAAQFISEHQEIVQTVAKVAIAMAGLKIGLLGARLGFLNVQKMILNVKEAIEILNIFGITKGFGKFGSVVSGIGSKFIKFGGSIGGLINRFTGIGNIIAMVTTKAAAIPGLLVGIGGKITTMFPLLGKLAGPLKLIGGIGGKIAGIAVAAAPIVGILMAIAGVMAVVATHSETARAKIAEIFGPEILTSLDSIWNAFSEIGNHIMSLMPTITASTQPLIGVLINLVNTIMPALAAIIQVCVPIVNALASTLAGVLSAAINTAIGVLSGLTTALTGIINFITGVFTGNWRQAWEGVKQIFSGIIESIKSLFTGAMNTIKSVISGIGDAVSGVASKIKGLVTGGGGGKVPGHAKGSSDTEGAFIAGEKGPELITGQPHKVVYTADETKNLFAAQQAAKAAMEAKPQAEAIKPQEAPAPTVIPQQGGGTNNNVTVTQTNNITINGDKPDNLEEVLKKNNEALLEEVDKKLGGDNDERRTRYE